MPVSCKKIGGKYRIVGPGGGIEKTAKGHARDGGGHATSAACGRQARAINASLATNQASPNRRDPSQTTALRQRFIRDMNRRFAALARAIRELVVAEDAFGLKAPTTNTRFAFLRDPAKVEAFRRWLQQQVDAGVLQIDSGDAWTATYVREAYRKGGGRAYNMVKKPALAEDMDIFDGTREEFLRAAFAQPTALNKVDLLAGRTFADLSGVSAGMAEQLGSELTEGLIAGRGPREIARGITKRVDIARSRALRIARTEIIRAHAEGALDTMEDLGVEEISVAVEWSTSEDGKVCPLCRPLDGMVIPIARAHGMFPRHPNCVRGDSVVEASDVQAIIKTHYTGEIIQIYTAEGRRIAVTPNHVLLTEYGFIQARFAYEGLKIFKAPISKRHFGKAPYHQHRKACIANVFASLCESGLVIRDRMPTARNDLHGEGRFCDTEIHIIRPDSELADKFDASPCGEFIKRQFPSLQFARTRRSLPGGSAERQFFDRVLFTFDRSMGLCRDFLALLLARVLHTHKHCTSTIAALNAEVIQAFADCGTTTPMLLRKCLDAHPILKGFSDISIRELQHIALGLPISVLPNLGINSELTQFLGDMISSNTKHRRKFAGSMASCVESGKIAISSLAPSGHSVASPATPTDCGVYATRSQTGSNSCAIYAKKLADRFGGMSGLIAFDNIVDIQIQHVQALDVYDVQTASSLCSIEGLLSSQCRCSPVPANVGESTRGQKRTKQSIRSALERSLRAEIPKRSKRSVATQRRLSSWQGAGKRLGAAPKPVVTPGR